MEYDEKSCGCIVIEGEKVLLVKHNAGHWDFPKGHMEEGETEEQTAIREVKEETNIDVKIPDLNRRYTVHYSPKLGVVKEVVYFIAKKISGEISPQEEEIEKLGWVEINEAPELITYQTSKDIMKQVIEDLDVQ